MIFDYYHSVNHIYNTDSKSETVDLLINGNNKATWLMSLSNEQRELGQGNETGIKGTDTIDFISRQQVLNDKDVAYDTFVYDYQLLKQEAYIIHIMVEEDRLSCAEDARSPASNLLETNMLINNIISDANRGVRFMSLNIKDYFLAIPIRDPEYMRVLCKYFLQDVRDQYRLDLKVIPSGWIFIEIKKGMSGLKQATLLAYQHLAKLLEPYKYTQYLVQLDSMNTN